MRFDPFHIVNEIKILLAAYPELHDDPDLRTDPI